MKKLNLCIVTLMVSGCSLVPYENEFSCQLEDNYGKCINVESAYEEAVTGVEQYPHMQKASERNRQARDERLARVREGLGMRVPHHHTGECIDGAAPRGIADPLMNAHLEVGLHLCPPLPPSGASSDAKEGELPCERGQLAIDGCPAQDPAVRCAQLAKVGARIR